MKIELEFETVDKIMVKELKRNYKSLRDDIEAIAARMETEWVIGDIPHNVWEDYNDNINVLGSIEILLGYYMVASEAEAWLEKNGIKGDL